MPVNNKLAILTRMEVPFRSDGKSNVFLLGCRERRVTIYSQQARALNLIYSLLETGRLKAGDNLAVVGAGVAGLTAAIGAAYKGLKVTVFEEHHTVVPFLHGNMTRYLHPHILDWPRDGAENKEADLPILNWNAGLSDKVAEELKRQWDKYYQKLNIELILGVKGLKLTINENSTSTLSWSDSHFKSREFRAVIMAVGYGVEKDHDNIEGVISYWQNEDIHQSMRPRGYGPMRCLISGTGDGGLIDLFRLAILDFRHDYFIENIISLDNLNDVKQELTEIENNIQSPSGLSDEQIFNAYSNLVISNNLIDKFKSARRIDTFVVLNGTGNFPIDRKASILNRFILMLLLKTGMSYVAGRLTKSVILDANKPSSLIYKVEIENEGSAYFDRVVVRHGPNPALNRFPELMSRFSDQKFFLDADDLSNIPVWDTDYFSLDEMYIQSTVSNGVVEADTVERPKEWIIWNAGIYYPAYEMCPVGGAHQFDPNSRVRTRGPSGPTEIIKCTKCGKYYENPDQFEL